VIDINFGLVTSDWETDRGPTLRFEVIGTSGGVLTAYEISLADLRTP
jgi:hypothetical protein